jgi:AhpD family alkylhydroperoxidase
MAENYSERYDEIFEQMGKLGQSIPQIMGPFSQLHKANGKDAALTAKTKELIALGIAVTIRCEGCIVCHVRDAMEAGASRDEIMETIGVAILMGGGPSVVYGCEAMEALEEYAAALVPA